MVRQKIKVKGTEIVIFSQKKKDYFLTKNSINLQDTGVKIS
jgi:hypothetical protein